MSDPRLSDIERRLDRLEATTLDATNQVRMQRERQDQADKERRELQVTAAYHGRVLFGDPGTATESLPAQLRKLRDEMEIVSDAIRAVRSQTEARPPAIGRGTFLTSVGVIVALLLLVLVVVSSRVG